MSFNASTEDQCESSLAIEDPRQQNDDQDERLRAAAELEEELARLKRLGIFSTFVAIVMMSFVFLPIVVPILLLIGGFLYAFAPCLAALPTLVVLATSSTAKGEEESTTTTGMLDDATDINHDAEINANFDETRHAVRSGGTMSSCRRPAPPQGKYRIIYAADYFGRALRTEGELCLQFHSSNRNNGWEIRGQSRSAASGPASRIDDGFLNHDGDMYWLVDGQSSGKMIQYRGTFDLETMEMYDGEFRTKEGTLKGRIIRLYLLKEQKVKLLDQSHDTEAVVEQDWGTTDIEMVAPSQNSLVEMT